MTLLSTEALAQRSKRVIRRDVATTTTDTRSEDVSPKKDPATGTTVTDSNVSHGIGWQPKPVYVPASTGVVAITGTTGTTNDNQSMQMMQALAGMLGGGQGGGSGTPANNTATNNGTNNGTNNATNPSNSTNNTNGTTPGSSPTGTTPGARNDETTPTSNAPLPQDTNVRDRDCADTRKTWQPPTKERFRVTSCFGSRASKGGRHHNGIDMVMEGSASINPVAPGRIIQAGAAGGYGCQIVIEHDSCPAAIGGSKCYSQYAHLKKEGGRCPGGVGQKVNACTKIATMGNTGASDGAHLHFEVRTGPSSSTARDPVTSFREWQAHSNYNYQGSTCGSVGNGRAPAKISTPGGTTTNGTR